MTAPTYRDDKRPRLGRKPVPPTERFWPKVDKECNAPCWTWTGHLTARQGYGSFSLSHDKPMPAHRFAYEELVGPIPEGLVLDHLCRNPACVNPDHLEPVTPKENVLRGIGVSAINARKTHCQNGHELAGDNLIVTPEGYRNCRECSRTTLAASRDRRRDEYNAQARRYCARDGAHKFGRKEWQSWEMELLTENPDGLSLREIAAKLERSLASVRSKLRKM